MNKWIIRVVCFYFWKCYFLNTQCNFFYINMSSLVINSFKNEINTIILKILRCVGSTSFSHSPLDALLWWYTVLCVSNLSRGGPNLWRASHINITGAYGRTSAVPYSIIYPYYCSQRKLSNMFDNTLHTTHCSAWLGSLREPRPQL